jgi:Ca-activated chloride channel family protein
MANHTGRFIFVLAAAGLLGGADGACVGFSDDSSGPLYGDAHAPHITEGTPRAEVAPFVDTTQEDTSTFSIDVDTASYTHARRQIGDGLLPDPGHVRVEEFINFFDYRYPAPPRGASFGLNTELASSHFGDNLELFRIGIQGKRIAQEDIKPNNLVFLIDTSGSMGAADKLPLVKRSLGMLVDALHAHDSIGIVTYSGDAGVALEPTLAGQKNQILAVINGLGSGGSTNGHGGIVEAYRLAETAKIEGGNNRVILMTDGDFNVGLRGQELIDLMASYREKHISLTCAGFGASNYNDGIMEAFARDANGNYVYVDSEDEAKRVFQDDLASTLEVIASDVKVQVIFEADAVKRYRLIGYENRRLENEDFDDDNKDAGEIGPGHNVTAYYEVELNENVSAGAMATVRVRWKSQYGEASDLAEHTIKMSDRKDFSEASPAFRFAAAVTEFGEILAKSPHTTGTRFDEVFAIAEAARSPGDEDQQEFTGLVEATKQLWTSGENRH